MFLTIITYFKDSKQNGQAFTVIINNSPSLAVYTLTNVRVLPNPNAMQKLHSYIGCINAPS